MKHLRDLVDNFLGHILVGEEGANRSYNGDILVIDVNAAGITTGA